MDRRKFLGSLTAVPLAGIAVKYADGKEFKFKEYVPAISYKDPKAFRYHTAILIDGKWYDGPIPEKATWFDCFPESSSERGQYGIRVKTKELSLAPLTHDGKYPTAKAFKLVDPYGKTISEKEMTVELGGTFADEYTLTVTFDLGGGSAEKRSQFQEYLAMPAIKKLFQEMKAQGL